MAPPESFTIERNAHAGALQERDRRIDKLEREWSQQAVTIARLEARLLQGDRDQSRVIDLPNMGLRKGLN